MTDELKPVRCGCGGEAKVIMLIPEVYAVECSKCYIRTGSPACTEAEAIEAWNKAMGADAYKSSATERTAKAKVNFKDENYFFGWCECGQYQSSQFPYCPACGARLEWE